MSTMLFILVALGMVNRSPENPPTTSLRVRVYLDAGVARTVPAGALDVAVRLLASAGVETDWHWCDPVTSCPESGSAAEALVLLSSHDRGDERCGQAASGTRRVGLVRISVGCVARVTARIARVRQYPSHPLLLVARYDDVVGAVIAHELGHLLGAGHSRSGVMRAVLGPEEVVLLREGKLAFTQKEAALMRARANVMLLARRSAG